MSGEDIRKKPAFATEDAELIAREHFGVSGEVIVLPGERDQNFRVGDFVLKIANPETDLAVLELENQAIRLSEACAGYNSASLIKSKRGPTIIEVSDPEKQTCFVRCVSFVPGIPLAEIDEPNAGLLEELGSSLASLDLTLASLNQNRAAKRDLRWDLKNAASIVKGNLAVHETDLKRECLKHFLEIYFEYESRINLLPESVIHNDANDYNLMVDVGEAPHPRIGIIDFGDIVYSHTINDLAICLAYVVLDKRDPVATASHVVAGYHRVRAISEEELSVLFPLMCMRLCQSVSIAAEQKRLRPDDEYLSISERPAWHMLERLERLDVGQVREAFREVLEHSIADSLSAEDELTAGKIYSHRKQLLGPSLSLSYDRPLHIVKGRGQYLYDANGLTFLDCVNNVCHVGHCHPQVVEAATQQLIQLNTNTRYLHENIVELAQRLTATLPAPLEVCYFVNSGSEANDLALRLARNFSGHNDILVLDNAYHGHTSALIDISPYKFDSSGGKGKQKHIHVAPAPDGYRGPYKNSDPDCGVKYARLAIEQMKAAHAKGENVAAFFAESLLSCGGQVPLPAGFLPHVYRAVRDQGGVCVADEVQVGFGRVGSHFWGFELQEVVPDIVTMGKPMGNGHPIAAVVTTREIADAFNNGMEYFNTFGGNPVSCAIGLAVLKVIENEGLQQHALKIGNWLLERLDQLKQTHSLIGDVRGHGLFLGIELVIDRQTLEPATEQARKIVNTLRGRNILLSTDGPFSNVIKFKPPMVFSQADAERLAAALDQVVGDFSV